MNPFRVVVADPCWKFSDKLPGKGRGADKHYETLTVDELMRFPLPPIADNAVLFMWRVSAMVEEAYAVARAWKFIPKSELVWLKQTKTGKRHFGMGRYVRHEHENCLIAVRGRMPVSNRAIRSTFEARIGRHSEKPDEFFDIVRRLYPRGPRAELFARRPRAGWSVYGNEIPGGEMHP